MSNKNSNMLITGLTIIGIGTFLMGSGLVTSRSSRQNINSFSTVSQAIGQELEAGYDLKNDPDICVLYDRDVTGKEAYHIVKRINGYNLREYYKDRSHKLSCIYSTGDGMDVAVTYDLRNENDYAYFNLLDGSVISVYRKDGDDVSTFGNEIIKSAPVASIVGNYLEDKSRYTKEDIEELYNKLNNIEKAETENKVLVK